MSYLTQFAAAAAGSTVQTLTVDVGGAISPIANNINLFGGNVLTTSGVGNTIAITLDNGSNGQLLIGGGSDPVWATMTSTDSSITVALGANTLDLAIAGIFAKSFPTDSGTATPSSGVLTVTGGTNINTGGLTSVVTVNLDAAITLATSVTSPIYQTDAGADLVLNMADDAATYSVSFTNNSDAEVAYIDSLGAASFTELDVDNININGNTIISSDADGNIVLTPNGTGTVNISYLTQYTMPITAGGSGEISDLSDGLGTSGEVLTSNGAGSEPTWQVTAASEGFTAGSVIFSNGTTLAEDNANFFWDDTNNRLGLGTATPLDTFQVVGNMCITHTAAESDDHALEIICDAAGFGDVKAIDIDFITGAVAAGQSEEAILINIDETGSSGGEVFGIEVLATAGSAVTFGLRTGVTVGPVAQFAGTLGDADTILNKAVDVTAALANGGAGNITCFVLDNETITIGDAAKFGEMEVIIDTPASGAGIAPTFEYSDGVGSWAAFSPTDGTNGMRNTGEIAWDPADIPLWIVGTGTEFLIRITRTRNTVTVKPILDEIQIAATTTYTWDKNGDLAIKNAAATVSLTTPLYQTDAGADLVLNMADDAGTNSVSFTNDSDAEVAYIDSLGAGSLTNLDVDNININGNTIISTDINGDVVLTPDGSGTVNISYLTQYTLPIAGASGAIADLADGLGASGEVLTSAGAGAEPTWVVPAEGGIGWNEETGTSVTMVVDNGYITNNAGLVTATLPTTAAVGSVVRVAGKGAGGWLIAQNASEIIHFGTTDTTTGVGGSLASTETYDAVELVCIVANTEWVVISSLGNITIV